MIRTHPRRGYRFVANVVQEDSTGTGTQPTESRPADIRDKEPETPPETTEKPLIVVLPFQNLSGDADQEYFADGVTEDLINALSRFRWAFVIGRNTSFSFKGRATGARDIAERLGVRYAVDGSVRKAGNRIRVTARLIEAPLDRQLWGRPLRP